MPDTTELSEPKRALLARYARGERPRTPARVDSIPRRPPGSAVPLSFGQQQLWLLAQLLPDVPLYNECVTIHLPGSLHVGALEQSLAEIIRRHEAWRTSFPLLNGQHVQAIQPAPAIKLPVTDLRHLTEATREAEALRLASEHARLPFDLARGPLLRALLVRLGDEEHRLFLTLHHIIFDGITIYQVFLPELHTLYEAYSSEQPSPLPELPIQYGDFAVWQRERLQGDIITDQLAYWKRQLAGAPTVLELPTDRPRPALPTYRGFVKSFALGESLTNSLRALNREQGVTPFTLLLTAFNTLLYRYTGQEDILVGTATSGRRHPEVEKLMGMFMNMVVIRTNLAGDPTFGELLARVREATLEAQAHADVPFEYVVKELQLERRVGQNPLFQVLFVLEPQPPVLPSGWSLTHMDARTDTSKFDLSIILEDQPEGIIGRFECSGDLFDATTIERMIGHWQTLLESIVRNPRQRVAELALLTQAERQLLLVEWNATTTNYLPERCVHQLFEAQVELTPDAIALVFGEEQLTYRELNVRANQLAHRLQQLGVGPDALVGLFLHNCLETMIGLLGILKAGGAYVPLDPAAPGERLALTLQDAYISILLTKTSLLELLPTFTATTTLCLDGEEAALAAMPSTNPVGALQGHHLAYVLYTSGSTGRPKGVAITHHNLWHSTQARLAYYRQPVTSYLLLSSITFDSSVAGIFWTLCSGGILLLPAELVVRDPFLLSALIEKQRPSHTLSVPSLYALLLEQAASRRLDSLQTIIVAGEPCPQELVERHWLWLPGSTLYNEYGPTEATVWCTVFRFAKGENRPSIPIGRPIANTQVYILDTHLQTVPIGVAGELYVGGAGLARAYLHQPALTAERFIPHPFSDEPGARLYRTGDQVRYLPDGNIEFLQRVDQQVKIRGYRIEVGEVEEALRRYPGVREATVAAREDIVGDKRLVAYVVPQAKGSITVDALRAHLIAYLPAYMLPSAYVLLEALPLLPNGKLNRRALPLPGLDQTQTASKQAFVAPRTPIEEVVAATWSELLGIKQVDMHDDFFRLGGHSLLAMHVVSRLRTVLQVELSLRSFFEAPTVAGLSIIIQQLKANGTGESMPGIRPISRESHRVTLSSISSVPGSRGSRNA